jgi:hypothetical protein
MGGKFTDSAERFHSIPKREKTLRDPIPSKVRDKNYYEAVFVHCSEARQTPDYALMEAMNMKATLRMNLYELFWAREFGRP